MRTNSNIDLGIGKNRGTGGDLWTSYAENGKGKGFGGVGGCFYLFSAKNYCLCTVNVPDGSHTKLTVTGDEVLGKSHTRVGTIEGDKKKYSFIVRKGATVNYEVTKLGYNKSEGSFPTGRNLNTATNVQTENISLGQKIYLEHTFALDGAYIEVTGNLYDSNGNVVSKISGHNAVKVRVAEESGTVNYKVTKAYYNDGNGSKKIEKSNDKGTTYLSLTPIKYFANSVSYAKDNKQYWFFGNHDWNEWRARNKTTSLSDEWIDTQLQEDKGGRDVYKFQKSGWGDITLTFNEPTAVSNWKVTLYKFRAGEKEDSSYVDVWVYNNAGQLIGSKTYGFGSKDRDYTESLSFTNQSIKTVKVRLRADNDDNRRIGIAAVYVENTK